MLPSILCSYPRLCPRLGSKCCPHHQCRVLLCLTCRCDPPTAPKPSVSALEGPGPHTRAVAPSSTAVPLWQPGQLMASPPLPQSPHHGLPGHQCCGRTLSILGVVWMQLMIPSWRGNKGFHRRQIQCVFNLIWCCVSATGTRHPGLWIKGGLGHMLRAWILETAACRRAVECDGLQETAAHTNTLP